MVHTHFGIYEQKCSFFFFFLCTFVANIIHILPETLQKNKTENGELKDTVQSVLHFLNTVQFHSTHGHGMYFRPLREVMSTSANFHITHPCSKALLLLHRRNFTEIIKQMWKVKIEINLHPQVKCNCHSTNFQST
jgi:hypothetical protein